jgi:TonB-linked SusC/RagA family outer membrane protein
MKLIIIIMTAILMQVSASSFAQRITFKDNNITLKRAFSEVKKQTGYIVLCKSGLLNRAKPIKLDLKNVLLEDALRVMLAGENLDFSIEDKSVVIKEKQRTILDKIVAAFIPIDIRGKVVDSLGNPLSRVVVTVKGSTQKTTTDAQGRYSLTGVDEQATLIFSMVGYVTREIPLSGKKQLDVEMQPSDTKLDEVMVVGYGTVRKRDLTGAVGQADVTAMAKAPVATFDQALAGRVAGVSVSSNDGQPGNSSNIVIRGGNSLTQSTAPLYVIDGFPMESYTDAPVGLEEIASLTVLKDASATAIYGARGANGVIVITTKKGKSGKPVIIYNGSLGYQSVTNNMEMMSPYDFVKYQLELTPLPAKTAYLDQNNFTLDDYRTKESFNWQDLLLQTAPIQIHNLSVRGGSPGTKYSVSAALYNQDGVVINSDYNRYTGRIALDQDISKKIKAGVNLSLGQTTSTGYPIAQGGSSMLGYVMYTAWAYRPVTGGDADLAEDFTDDDPQNTGSFLRINPVINANEEMYKNSYADLSLNSYLSYEILQGLTLKITGALTNRKSQNQYFFNSRTSRGTSLGSSNTRGVYGGVQNNQNMSWLNENTLNYQKKLSKHEIEVLAGFTMQKSNSEKFSFEAQKVPNEELGIAALGSGTPYTNLSGKSLNTLASFFGRLNYNFDSKYLLTLTMRADGSSKFPTTNKWGYFPSGAVAWRMKEEDFLKNIKAISDAKLRVSYGVTGNNRVGDFSYFPGLILSDTYGYSFGDAIATKGLIYGSMGNSQLKWESTRQLDLGLEVGLFKDRISLSADVYRKTTSNLLLNASLPRTTGFTTVLENIGMVRNQGLELTLNTINIRKSKFSWESNFNIAFNSNKIMELVSGEENLRTSVNWDNFYQAPLYIARVGQPAALFYGYVWDGNYQYSDFDEVAPGRYVLKGNVATSESTRPAVSTVQPGDIKYKDINGDGVITTADQSIIGNPQPIHTGGFSNSFSYGKFSLNVLLQWSYGNDIYNANRMVFEGNSLGRPGVNQYVNYTNRWTPQNQNNELYRTGGNGPLGYYSSRVIEDGSFLRLKTVALAYSLPSALAKKLYMTNLSFNLSAQNLLVWTKYQGMDPEVSIRQTALTPGFDFSAYPRARTIVFGINANF